MAGVTICPAFCLLLSLCFLSSHIHSALSLHYTAVLFVADGGDPRYLPHVAPATQLGTLNSSRSALCLSLNRMWALDLAATFHGVYVEACPYDIGGRGRAAVDPVLGLRMWPYWNDA